MSLKGQLKSSFTNLIVLISYYIFSCPHRLLLTQYDTSKKNPPQSIKNRQGTEKYSVFNALKTD